MVRITEDLIRRRAEHNQGILHSLREVTLHQFEIERIELLGTLCRHLQILYLQNNIINKIADLRVQNMLENLNRLKELQYLNLAVNNIEVIENLERCESLNKLDLTVNFIDIDALQKSCENLRVCKNLRELYLLGNPCTTFPRWRLYIIHNVPQLQSIDGVEILKSERILAKQESEVIAKELQIAAEERVIARHKEAEERADNPEQAATAHTPEARTKMYREVAEMKEKKEESSASMFKAPPNPVEEAHKKMSIPASEGTDGELPRQRNTGRYEFSYSDSDHEFIVCTVAAPKFLDTSLLDVDVHPRWFQVKIKSKLLLLHLPEEVVADETVVQRVVTTGALVIKMKRAETQPRIKATHTVKNKGEISEGDDGERSQGHQTVKKTELHNIVKEKPEPLLKEVKAEIEPERKVSRQDYTFDIDEVPPLE